MRGPLFTRFRFQALVECLAYTSPFLGCAEGDGQPLVTHCEAELADLDACELNVTH